MFLFLFQPVGGLRHQHGAIYHFSVPGGYIPVFVNVVSPSLVLASSRYLSMERSSVRDSFRPSIVSHSCDMTCLYRLGV